MNTSIGDEGFLEYVVKMEDTALVQGSGDLPVLSTPRLVALMEGAAVRVLQEGLAPGETSVGIRIDIRHLAATPVGETVCARARVAGMEDRKITFEVEAGDRTAVIGKGTHQRYIVQASDFMERTRNRHAVEESS